MKIAAFDREQVVQTAEFLEIDWTQEAFDIEALHKGMEVELEHGSREEATDITHDDPVLTAKIALAHLREFPDYYERLASMEAKAEAARAVTMDEDLGIF
jgi:hypothetical protein